MTLITVGIVFVVALVALVKGSDVFVDSAKRIGSVLGLPTFVIGVLIVGVGTSLPELAAGLAAIFSGATEIVAANAVGSNITNILLIGGFVAVIAGRIVINRDLLKSELAIFVVSTVHFVAVSIDGHIDRVEASLLLGTYAVYIIYLIIGGEEESMVTGERGKEGVNGLRDWGTTIALFVLGLAGVLVGAKFMVDSVLTIATLLSVPTSVITMTAIALGTSLPELAVSVSAALKGQIELAFGNIFGSNAFNILVAVGLPAIIMPLSIDEITRTFGIGIFLSAAVILLVIGIARQVARWEGLMLLLFYAFFVIKLIG